MEHLPMELVGGGGNSAISVFIIILTSYMKEPWTLKFFFGSGSVFFLINQNAVSSTFIAPHYLFLEKR